MIPFVSAIMPTRGRPEMARAAVFSWLTQDWPHTELVIVDDKDSRSFPDGLDLLEGVQLVVVSSRNLGEKRNIACGLALGKYIVHFDDDDWSAPHRISDQVQRLIASGKAVTGYHSLTFHEMRPLQVLTESGLRPASAWWRWRDRHGLAAGTSLCYRRDWWHDHLFVGLERAEDDLFWAEAVQLEQAIATDGHEMICAANHAGCVSGRAVGGAEWEELPGDPRGLPGTLKVSVCP
jgi:glycosyltransferase involved in cell wall biosynthesis